MFITTVPDHFCNLYFFMYFVPGNQTLYLYYLYVHLSYILYDTVVLLCIHP